MQRIVRACVALTLVSLAAGAVLGQGPTTTPAEGGGGKIDESRIRKLIEQLGSDRWRVREEATRALAEIGPAAMGALREAMLSDDLEVSTRARTIYSGLVTAVADQLQKVRGQVHEAFAAGDYQRMTRSAEWVVATGGDSLLDWLWLGHGCQLAGNWQRAAVAYEKVVHLLGVDLKVKAKEVAIPVRGGKVLRPRGGDAQGELVLFLIDPRHRKKLLEQRIALAMWVARIQSGPLTDPKAAAVTLAEADKFLDAASMGVSHHVRLPVLKELAAARHESGDLQGAFVTWAKLFNACLATKRWPHGPCVDMERIGRAVRSLPAGKPVPQLPMIFPLTPDRPRTKLMLGDPKTRRRSYWPSANTNSPHWRYAFCPPPGKEFATLNFACDIEQIKLRHSGQLSCYVMTDSGGRPAKKPLGSIRWTRDKVGREIVRKKVDVPPGSGIVHIETGTWRGYFNVYNVEVTATFRPVTKDPKPLVAGAWMQTELWPKGGTATCGDRKLADEHAYSDFPPGKYVLGYQVPGRSDGRKMNFVVAPGRRYGIFFNLDSPFRRTQAVPTDLNAHPSARRSIVRLPDGGFLAVWDVAGKRIMLSRTADFVTWTAPAAAPFNSIFDDIAPATYAAPDGTVWVAYFSKRLSLLDTRTSGYRLWLTSTRDGRKWTPIKPVAIDGVSGWPLVAPTMCTGPDGKSWIFWCNRGGSAKSLAQVRQLRPMGLRAHGPGRPHMLNQHVTLDPRGAFHMVYDSFGRGVYHATSKDALTWTVPTLRVIAKHRQVVGYPHLIFVGDKALLIYSWHATYITPIKLAGPYIEARQGIMITGRVASLKGSQMTLTKDGEVLLLAGSDTSWLLRAKVKDLSDIKIGK